MSAEEQMEAAHAGSMVGGPRRYRKKPAVIEAIRFTGDNDAAVAAFVGVHGRDPDDDRPSWLLLPSGTMHDDELTVNVGDWIIRGVEGELYPCKPDIFDATYDPVQVGAR